MNGSPTAFSTQVGGQKRPSKADLLVERSAEGVEPRVALLFGLLGLAELEADHVSKSAHLYLGGHLARTVLVLTFEHRPSKLRVIESFRSS